MQTLPEQLTGLERQIVVATSQSHVDQVYRLYALKLGQASLNTFEKIGALTIESTRLLSERTIPPAAPISTGPTSSATDDNAPAFPEAVAALENGGLVGVGVRELAKITVGDMKEPKPDAPATAFVRHYSALVTTGQSLKAGVFYDRHRAKIRGGLEDERLG